MPGCPHRQHEAHDEARRAQTLCLERAVTGFERTGRELLTEHTAPWGLDQGPQGGPLGGPT